MAKDELRDAAFEIIGICSMIPNGVDGETRKLTDVIRRIEKKLKRTLGIIPPAKEDQKDDT